MLLNFKTNAKMVFSSKKSSFGFNFINKTIRKSIFPKRLTALIPISSNNYSTKFDDSLHAVKNMLAAHRYSQSLQEITKLQTLHNFETKDANFLTVKYIQAECYVHLSNFSKAQEKINEFNDIYSDMSNPDDLAGIKFLILESEYYYRTGNLEEMLKKANLALRKLIDGYRNQSDLLMASHILKARFSLEKEDYLTAERDLKEIEYYCDSSKSAPWLRINYLYILAEIYRGLGNHNSAYSSLLIAKNIGQEFNIQDDYHCLMVDIMLASYDGNIDKNKFENYYRDACDKLKGAYGEESFQYFEVRNKFSVYLYSRERYSETVPILEENIKIANEVFKNKSLIASSYQKQAATFFYLQKYQDAWNLIANSLANISDGETGLRKRIVATARDIKYSLENFEEAVAFGEEYMRIIQSLYGKENEEYLNAVRDLAQTCGELGKIDTAINYIKETLNVLESKRINDETLAMNLYLLGNFQIVKKDEKNALDNIKKSIDLFKKGNFEYNAAKAEQTLAKIYAGSNNLALAIELYKNSINTLARVRSGEDPVIYLSMLDLSGLEKLNGNIKNSIKYAEAAINLRKRHHDENDEEGQYLNRYLSELKSQAK